MPSLVFQPSDAPPLVKDEGVQALVAHVLVDEHPLGAVDAAAEEADQVPVLQLGDQDHLVHELVQALRRVIRRELLHSNLLPVRQLPLVNFAESASADNVFSAEPVGGCSDDPQWVGWAFAAHKLSCFIKHGTSFVAAPRLSPDQKGKGQKKQHEPGDHQGDDSRELPGVLGSV